MKNRNTQLGLIDTSVFRISNRDLILGMSRSTFNSGEIALEVSKTNVTVVRTNRRPKPNQKGTWEPVEYSRRWEICRRLMEEEVHYGLAGLAT